MESHPNVLTGNETETEQMIIEKGQFFGIFFVVFDGFVVILVYFHFVSVFLVDWDSLLLVDGKPTAAAHLRGMRPAPTSKKTPQCLGKTQTLKLLIKLSTIYY